MTDRLELPDFIRLITNQLVADGAPPEEVVSLFMGAAIDLAETIIGADGVRRYLANVAIRLDEELNFGG